MSTMKPAGKYTGRLIPMKKRLDHHQGKIKELELPPTLGLQKKNLEMNLLRTQNRKVGDIVFLAQGLTGERVFF